MKSPRIACSLPGVELLQRRGSLLARLRSVVTATEELSDGYAFTLPGDKRLIQLGAKVLAAERECCPFLRFEVVAQPNGGPLVVRVTGPEGTKEFLKETFGG